MTDKFAEYLHISLGNLYNIYYINIYIYYIYMYIIRLPVQKTQVWFLGQEDPSVKQPTPVFLPGKSHGGAIPFSRGSSQTRDWTQVSGIAGRFCTTWATREETICEYVCVCVCVCVYVFIYMIQYKFCYRAMFIVRILNRYGMN